jgi:hypothetical protein
MGGKPPTFIAAPFGTFTHIPVSNRVMTAPACFNTGRSFSAIPATLCVAAMFCAGLHAQAQHPAAPLPDIHDLMRQVEEHQHQLDKVRENYTYTSLETTQDIDSSGQVKKTETEEYEVFFVNGHEIHRLVKKDGKPLDAGADKKEAGRVTKDVEKAQKTPPDKSTDGSEVSITKILSVMDVRNPRRDLYHGRPTIVFDFIGRKDAKTHGLAEDASKKLQGTLWVDEADREVAHLDVSFDDNFKIGGGLVATIQKGSNFHFEQSPINGELWLPVGADASFQARIALLKGVRQRFSERDSDFKRFHVDTQQNKDAKTVAEKKP